MLYNSIALYWIQKCSSLHLVAGKLGVYWWIDEQKGTKLFGSNYENSSNVLFKSYSTKNVFLFKNMILTNYHRRISDQSWRENKMWTLSTALVGYYGASNYNI